MKAFETKVMENSVVFYIDDKIYGLKNIMKAAYKFIEAFYISMNYVDDLVEVNIERKCPNKSQRFEEIKGEFYNELLRQCVRYNISHETKDIRELIMGRALYDTCIEYDENEVKIDNSEEIIDEDNILINWFDNNEV